MPNPNYTLNYEDFIRQVNPLLNGGSNWRQKDGDPYGLSLQLADGRTWNPSGAQSGVTYLPAGSTSGGEWVNQGGTDGSAGYYTDVVTNPNESWEVSGDLSALYGAPGSRKHTNIRYERQGDKLVPVNQSDWDWVSPYNDVKNIGLLAATAAGAGYGFDALNAAIGAGGAGGAAAGTGVTVGGPMGLGAQGLAATELGALGAAAPVVAGTTGLLSTVAPAVAGTTGLLSGIGSLADLAKLALPIAGAVLGSKPTTTTSTNQSRLDPRMDPYIYGPDGVLPAAQEWYKANKTGLNDQMRQGLATQTAVLNDPATMAGFKQMQGLGSGLLSAPIAGNPFSDGRASLTAPRPQLYR